MLRQDSFRKAGKSPNARTGTAPSGFRLNAQNTSLQGDDAKRSFSSSKKQRNSTAQGGRRRRLADMQSKKDKAH